MNCGAPENVVRLNLFRYEDLKKKLAGKVYLGADQLGQE